MPTLANQRHELFAQEIAKGKTLTEAYVLAGFKPSRRNASRLATKEDIERRVRELQDASAACAVIDIQSICRELDAAVEVARSKGQAQAMVSASALRAKLAGLLRDRVEVGNAGDFEGCETIEQIVDQMLAGPGGPIEQFHPVDARDRQGLLDLIERHHVELHEFMEAIKSRPMVAARVELRDLSRPWQELELQAFEVRRLTQGNGRQRKP